MCGLAGIVSTGLTDKLYLAWCDMMHFNVVRGPHSYGMGYDQRDKTDDKRKYYYRKDVGAAPWVELNSYAKETIKGKGTTLLGHTRYATQGKITEENAHPFTIKGLLGAHNGTLTSWKWSLREAIGDEIEKYEVDSHALYAAIGTKSFTEVIENHLGYNPAYALTFFDLKKNTFNILRNKERTLFYAFTEDYKALLYASEAWMIICAVSRQGVKLSPEGVRSFDENTHYLFDLDTIKKEDKVVFQVSKVEPKVKYSPLTERQRRRYGGWGGYYGNYFKDDELEDEVPFETPKKNSSWDNDDIFKNLTTLYTKDFAYKSLGGVSVSTVNDILREQKNSCTCCGSPIVLDFHADTTFFKMKEGGAFEAGYCLCRECSKDRNSVLDWAFYSNNISVNEYYAEVDEKTVVNIN